MTLYDYEHFSIKRVLLSSLEQIPESFPVVFLVAKKRFDIDINSQSKVTFSLPLDFNFDPFYHHKNVLMISLAYKMFFDKLFVWPFNGIDVSRWWPSNIFASRTNGMADVDNWSGDDGWKQFFKIVTFIFWFFFSNVWLELNQNYCKICPGQHQQV